MVFACSKSLYNRITMTLIDAELSHLEEGKIGLLSLHDLVRSPRTVQRSSTAVLY